MVVVMMMILATPLHTPPTPTPFHWQSPCPAPREKNARGVSACSSLGRAVEVSEEPRGGAGKGHSRGAPRPTWPRPYNTSQTSRTTPLNSTHSFRGPLKFPNSAHCFRRIPRI